MILQDYHIHTRFSCDSHASMTEMCRTALELGIPEIGISDHYDLFPEDPCHGYFKPDAWWIALEQCRTEFKGLLHIRAGIELGEPHRFPQAIRDILQKYPWDYALGSLHWVGAEFVFHRSYFNQPAEVAYGAYFRELYQMVTQADFDILAHMDIVKRYGFDEYGDYEPRRYETDIRAVLRACAQKDIALEVNTSTLRRPIQQTSPSAEILTWFHEEGGRWITLGSDAHRPENVGAGLEKALRLVRDVGFEHLASFEARQARRLNDHPEGE
jgi:histidinol-phosphatase (PHP family)